MLIVFASFFMLFILSNSNVFAASNKSIDFSYDNKNYSLKIPDGMADFSYYFISVFYNSTYNGYEIQLFAANSPFVFVKSANESFNEYIFVATKDRSNFFVCETKEYYTDLKKSVSTFIDNNFGVDEFDMSRVEGGAPILGLIRSFDKSYIAYSNNDITYFDSATGEENTFFQKAKEPTQLTIIAQSMDFLAVIKEILGILPMILVVLIGLLALMKAIKEIFKMLRKA